MENLLRVLAVMALVFMAGILASMSATLGKIARDFIIVQELQKEVTRIEKLTECLEPAREPESHLSFPEIEEN